MCERGPRWTVNMVNMNLYMKDIPLWYRSPVGPSVQVALSYNSRTSHSGDFGNKWQMNYGSYLYTMVNDSGIPAAIAVIMPDGKWDIYGLPEGSGACKPPYHVFHTLTKILDNRFELKFSDGTAVSYTYDSAGRLLSTTNARNLSSTYTYDNTGNLTGIHYTPDPTHLTYPNMFQYDPYNRRTFMTDASGTTGYSYSADSLQTGVDGPLEDDTLTLEYDKKGRITVYSLEQGQSVSCTYDHLDRVTSMQTGAGTFSYAYAGNGPLIQRLTRPNESYTEYEYDGMNRLISVLNKKSTGETISRYRHTYNDQDLISSEAVTDGAALASFVGRTTTYSYNNVNELLAVANPAQTFSYDAFGNLLSRSGELDQPFRFSTKSYDAKTGLSDFGYRFYAPAIGRWTTRDPLEGPPGFNAYEFVKNDPVNRWDPDGFDDCPSGFERADVIIHNDDDTLTRSFMCFPERSLWKKIGDWLESLVVREELKHERAVAAHQCRPTAGDSFAYTHIERDGNLVSIFEP